MHAKKRKAYEKDTLIALVIAALSFLFLLLLPIIQGRFDIQFILASLLICLAIVFMAVILKYVPATEESKDSQEQPKILNIKKKKTSSKEKMSN